MTGDDEATASEGTVSEAEVRTRFPSFRIFGRTGNPSKGKNKKKPIKISAQMNSNTSNASPADGDRQRPHTPPKEMVAPPVSQLRSSKIDDTQFKTVTIDATSHDSSKRGGGRGRASSVKSAVINSLKQRFRSESDKDREAWNASKDEEEEEQEDSSKYCEYSRNYEDSAEVHERRPWRLEKAANVQKPKTLHKTGKEKKEDSFRQAPRPPPAPAEMSRFRGYETCLMSRMIKISAPKQERKPLEKPPENAEKIGYQGSITDLEIKTAMKTWIWRRTGFKHFDIVRHMKVESITPRHRYRYKVESFMERRCVRWIKLPYHGDDVDQDEPGVRKLSTKAAAPLPWDIDVRPTNGTLWEEETILMSVPGTSLVHLCGSCKGKGWICCWKCDQAGNYLCYWCDGKGGFYDGEGHWKYCWTCKGIGIVYCTICKGYTKLVCVYCEGYFEVRFIIQLKIEFFIKVHKYYIEVDKTDVPIQKEKKWTGCRSGSGERVLEGEADKLAPLFNFNVREVNEISKGALTRHDNYYSGLRIHRQRHFVDVIPVYEVGASWKTTNFVFWIYGQKDQRKIFFPDAEAFLPPRKLCCVL